MPTSFRAIAAALLLVCMAGAAFSTTYYVSTSGSDGWPGTSEQPWRTIQYAVNQISAGDTIIVRAGTYVGARIGNSGTSSAPKTLKVDTGATVTLNQPSASAAHNGILEIELYDNTVSYWVIDGFVVNGQNKTYRCIDTRGTNHITIKNCTVTAAYMTGIFNAFCDYVLVENNTSYSNGEHGIYCNNSPDYGTIRGNTVYTNTSCGIHMNGDASMGGDGIMSYWLVEKNTSYSNPSGSAINCDGVHNSKFYNNLCYNNTGSGMSLYAIDGSHGSSNNYVYNNTIVMPSGGRWAMNIPSGTGTDPYGNKIKNNILYNASSTEGSIVTYSTSISGFESDYNVVIDRFSVNEDSSTIPLSTWRTYGWDTHSFISNPTALFVNPGSNDYHLKSDSPAKDAGTTLSDVTTDKDGNSRPQGTAYDIGCYEYLSGVADLVITTTSLPGGTVDVAYSQTVQATGGVTPYSWSIVSGSLPPGLSLGSSTGTISGTPTTANTYNFTVRVTDSQEPADTDDQALSIVISSGGATEKTYQQGLNGYSGWEDSWITEDNPTTNYSTLDSAHLQYYTQDRQLHKFDISDIPSGATINSATLSFYNYQVSGGTPTVNAYRIITDWNVGEVTYNNAKTGVSWGTPGMLSGTDYASTPVDTSASITGAMWVDFDVKDLVQDWVDGTYANRGVMFKLASAGHAYTRMAEYATQSYRPKLVVNYTSGGVEDLQITTTSLPDGQVGVAYSQTVQATGGQTPYSWSIVSGSLPSGLSLGSSTGTISGTPTAYGTSNFTVRVTDSQSPADTDDQALSIYIAPADLQITTTSLPDGVIGQGYSQTVQATGGVTPYSWSIVSGSLPPGLSLGSSTGTISGTPTTADTYNFTVRVTDSQGTPDTDDQALSITIQASASSYEFSASDGESYTTSTSYQTKVSLGFTPSVADDWVILAFAEYKGSSTSYSTLVRLTVDGTTEAETTAESNDSSDYCAFTAMKVKNLTAASHTIALQYRSENSGATARIRNARVVAIRKAALEIRSTASDSTTALTTTLTNYATLAWTPPSAGDYLLVFAAEVSARTNYSTNIQAKYEGSLYDDAWVESKDNSDYFSWMSFMLATTGTSQVTATVTAAKESGSTSTHNIRRARIVAIRVSEGRFSDHVDSSSDSEATTTSTSFQEKLTKSWTWGPSGNWLILVSARIAGTSTSYSNETRVQVNDSATSAQQLREPNDTSDYMQFATIDVRNLSSSRKVDVDYRSENSSATAKIKTVRFYGLSLDD